MGSDISTVDVDSVKRISVRVRSTTGINRKSFEGIFPPKSGNSQSDSVSTYDSFSNICDDDDSFGWFADIETNEGAVADHEEEEEEWKTLERSFTLPVPLTTTPGYVLESSLSCQKLWYQTAGRRPKQPSKERLHFEKLWIGNIHYINLPLFV